MLKKIILSGAILALIISGSTFAFGVNESATTNFDEDGAQIVTGVNEDTRNQNNTDDIMDSFDDIVKEAKDKKQVMCTMEFAPVCGKLENGKEKTFSNACQARVAGVKISYKGKCDSDARKEQQKTNFEKIDPTKLNIKFDNKKDMMAVPTVGVEVGGQLKNESKGVPYTKSVSNIEADSNITFNWSDGKLNVIGDTKVNFKQGLKIKNNLIKINTDDEKDEIKLFGEDSSMEVDIDDDFKFQIKNGKIMVENSEIKIDVDTALEKAKKVYAGEIILNSEITEDDGKIIYNIEVQKTGKFLGIFDWDMSAGVKVNVETGAVVEVDEPWYSFLVF